MNSLEWLQFTLSYVFQASLVIAVAWGFERWSASSRVKARIWVACYVSVLLLFVIGLVLPRLQWFHPWSTLQPRELLLVATTENVLGPTFMALWALGSSVVLLLWVVQFVTLQRFLRSCAGLTRSQRSRVFEVLPPGQRDVHGREVDLRIGPEDFGPFCYQFHQPVICLPTSLIQGPREILRHVVEHEMTHLRTHHPLQLFFQRTVQMLLWFHPLVWVSSRRASLVREFECDEVATQENGSTVTYLRTLVKIVEERSVTNSGTLAIGRSKKELVVRARRLAELADGRPAAASWRLVVALACVSLFCSQVWLPTNPLASSSTRMSSWPNWSAAGASHAFNFPVRDYERLDQNRLRDRLEDAGDDD